MAVNRSSGGSRPTSRERNSSSASSRSADQRGGGLNLGGPAGNSGGYDDRPTGGSRSRGGGSIFVSLWVVVLIVMIFVIGMSNLGESTDTKSGSSGILGGILHRGQETLEEIDADDLAERFSGVIQNAGESLGLIEGTAAAAGSRFVVDQFSGLLSGDADYAVSAISRRFDATEQYGGMIDASKFVWL